MLIGFDAYSQVSSVGVIIFEEFFGVCLQSYHTFEIVLPVNYVYRSLSLRHSQARQGNLRFPDILLKQSASAFRCCRRPDATRNRQAGDRRGDLAGAGYRPGTFAAQRLVGLWAWVSQDSILLECLFALTIVQAQRNGVIDIQLGIGLPLQDRPQRALRSQVEQVSK